MTPQPKGLEKNKNRLIFNSSKEKYKEEVEMNGDNKPKPPIESTQMNITCNTLWKLLHRYSVSVNTIIPHIAKCPVTHKMQKKKRSIRWFWVREYLS